MIYFIQAVSGGPIKIGYAKNIWSRLGGLQTSHPEKLTVLGYIEGDLETERSLHDRFAESRLSGEWFTDTCRIRAFIAERCAAPTPEEHWERGLRDEDRDAREYEEFATSFRAALVASFGTGPRAAATVAKQANVNKRTAENWLSGVTLPQGIHLLRLAVADKAIAKWMWGFVRKIQRDMGIPESTGMDPEFERELHDLFKAYQRVRERA